MSDSSTEENVLTNEEKSTVSANQNVACEQIKSKVDIIEEHVEVNSVDSKIENEEAISKKLSNHSDVILKSYADKETKLVCDETEQVPPDTLEDAGEQTITRNILEKDSTIKNASKVEDNPKYAASLSSEDKVKDTGETYSSESDISLTEQLSAYTETSRSTLNSLNEPETTKKPLSADFENAVKLAVAGEMVEGKEITDVVRSGSNDEEEKREVKKPSESMKECKEFVSNISDAVKFCYAGLCATTLHHLYGTEKDKDYRHHFITSFVAHLSLTSNVMNTMLAISDGQALADCSKHFLKDLLDDTAVTGNKNLLVQDLVSWCVMSSKGRYDSRSRILIRHISWMLPLQLEDLEVIEKNLLQMLSDQTEEEKNGHKKSRQKVEKNQKIKRFALIGLATTAGGALIGLTGGLAAPLVAAGAGAILGGASAAALSSVAGIAIITSLFGAAGAGLTGYKMNRRVGGIDEFEFQPLTTSNQLAITIAISGWLSDDKTTNYYYPWRNMHQSSEQYTLLWESEHLKRLGKAFEYILDSVVSFAATEALKFTALAGLITAVAWPASILSVASVIDNPWSVCLQRSSQAGRQLAEVLIAREHGQRPVTLVGYSLGAKVIFDCLKHLQKKKKHSGIIEDVFLIGAPVSGKPEDWEGLSTVVAGHITNAYCKGDWLLKFLYRTSSGNVKVAGLQPVEWENRRMMNIDLSSIVTGHMDYVKNINTILSAVGIRTTELVRSPTGCVLLQSSDKR